MRQIMILAGAAALSIGLALPASASGGDPGSECLVLGKDMAHIVASRGDSGIILPSEGAGEIIYFFAQDDSFKGRVIEPELLDKMVMHVAIKVDERDLAGPTRQASLDDPFEGMYKDPIAGHIGKIGTLERGAEKLKAFERGFLPMLMT